MPDENGPPKPSTQPFVIVSVPFFDILTWLLPPTCKSISKLAEAEAVSVMLACKAVKVTPALFQVCASVKAGELAVSVPLLAESVVNAPVFGVVEPIGPGEVRSTLPAKNPIN